MAALSSSRAPCAAPPPTPPPPRLSLATSAPRVRGRQHLLLRLAHQIVHLLDPCAQLGLRRAARDSPRRPRLALACRVNRAHCSRLGTGAQMVREAARPDWRRGPIGRRVRDERVRCQGSEVSARAPTAPVSALDAEGTRRRSARVGGRCGARCGVDAWGDVVGCHGGRAVRAVWQEGPCWGGDVGAVRYMPPSSARDASSAGGWQIPDSRFRVGGKLPKLGSLDSTFHISDNCF